MPVDPVPVDVIRDGVDWFLLGIQVASLVGAVIALFLAYGQIKQARLDARKAQQAQLEERRVDFELTVLRELLIASARVDYWRARALASTLAPSVVPITRGAVQLPTTPHGQRVGQRIAEGHSWPDHQYRESYLSELKDEIADELLEAIGRRVHEREPIGSD